MANIRGTRHTVIYRMLHRKLKIEQHETPLKTRGELKCTGRVGNSYSFRTIKIMF
jgi:hypothetical protein